LLFCVGNSSSNFKGLNRTLYRYKRLIELQFLPPKLQCTNPEISEHQKQILIVFTLVDFGVFVHWWHF